MEEHNSLTTRALRPDLRHRSVRSSAAIAVAAEGTAEAGEEGDEEGDEGAENEPVGVLVVGDTATAADVVAGDAEEHHFDDPHDEREEEGHCGDQGHEDSAHAVVRRAAEPEEPREAGKASSWWSERG